MLGLRGLLIGLLSFSAILAPFKFKTFHFTLILFLLGSASHLSTIHDFKTQFKTPELKLIIPSQKDFMFGLESALIQIPLTITNSFLASAALVDNVFQKRLKIDSIANRVVLMNFIPQIFGGMSIGHGVAGIAIWGRFGTRTSRNMLSLSSPLLFIGTFPSSLFFQIMDNSPSHILAAMLLFVFFESYSQIRSLPDLVIFGNDLHLCGENYGLHEYRPDIRGHLGKCYRQDLEEAFATVLNRRR